MRLQLQQRGIAAAASLAAVAMIAAPLRAPAARTIIVSRPRVPFVTQSREVQFSVRPYTISGKTINVYVGPPESNGGNQLSVGLGGKLWYTINTYYGSVVSFLPSSGRSNVYSIPSSSCYPEGILETSDSKHMFVTANGCSDTYLFVGATGVATSYDSPSSEDINVPTIGSDKRIWGGECCNGEGHMFAISDGAKLTTYTLPNMNEQVNQTTLGPDKNVWYTNTYATLGKITAKGAAAEFAIDFASNALVTGSDGRIWFASSSTPEIGRINTDGTGASYFTRGITGIPHYMVLGPDKNIYFSEYDSSTYQAAIGKITPSGSVTEYALPYGFNPYGIVVGPDSNIWTIDGSHDQLGQLVISSG